MKIVEKDYYLISIEGKPTGYLETCPPKILDIYDRTITLEKVVNPEEIKEIKNVFREKFESSEVKSD